jgi:hypothetical protein
MKTRTATFELEKETKNTVRYSETPDEGVAPMVNTIYIQKHIVGKTPPSNIKVTVEGVK